MSKALRLSGLFGWVLGTLSLRTGSMWWGAAIHTAVAWGMDLLSLGHQGRL